MPAPDISVVARPGALEGLAPTCADLSALSASRARSGRGFLPSDARGVLPEPLELVVAAVLVDVDVNDDLDEVQEDPTAFALPFPADGLEIALGEDLLHLVRDRPNLPVGRARRDHEIVGDHDQVADLEDDDVGGLLLTGRPRGRDRRIPGSVACPCRQPNPRQVRTIAEAVEEHLTGLGGPKPRRIEGLDDLTWVLLDYGEFVVHVFNEESRRYYELERLWADVPKVDWAA